MGREREEAEKKRETTIARTQLAICMAVLLLGMAIDLAICAQLVKNSDMHIASYLDLP